MRSRAVSQIVFAADRTPSTYGEIYSVAASGKVTNLSRSPAADTSPAGSPDGKHVAAAGVDKTIRIWRLGDKEGTLENTLIAHEDAILKLAWSPDGKLLASASADRSVKLFRAADLTEIRAISKLPDWAFGLQFAPAGDKFAAGFFNGTFEIYDVASR